MRIREVRGDELPLLREIERAAGACFRDVGMPEIADDEPLPLEELARYRRGGTTRAEGPGGGLAWVAVDDTDRPVGYLLAAKVDGNAHVEQVSVHPGSARRGIGRALLDQLAVRAAAGGMPALTLTTFTHVPWNAPYYARCGFAPLEESSLGPGLRAVREREAAHGLDRWPRVCVRRAV